MPAVNVTEKGKANAQSVPRWGNWSVSSVEAQDVVRTVTMGKCDVVPVTEMGAQHVINARVAGERNTTGLQNSEPCAPALGAARGGTTAVNALVVTANVTCVITGSVRNAMDMVG